MMRDFFRDLTADQRQKYGQNIAFLIILGFMTLTSLTLGIIAAICLLACRFSEGNLWRISLMISIPLLCSFVFGWITANGIFLVQDFGHNVMGKPEPQALVWQSWYDSPFQPLHNPANKAGRGGVVAGAIAGLGLVYLARKQKGWHGPGTIRGDEVVKGGWADLTHLADKCDFGPPKEGAGGIPIGRLQGQIVRVMPNKGKIKTAGHMIIIGPPGSGKSFTIIRDLIIAAECDGHSIVVTDPKGELYSDNANWLKQKGYRVIPFNVVDPAHSLWWNMIEECKDFDEVLDLAAWLIAAAGDDHAFFSGGEKNILASVFALAKWVLPQGQKHIRSAMALLSWPQETLDQVYTQAYLKRSSNGLPEEAYETWKGAQGHFTNYIEGVRNKVREITKGPLAALTSQSDFYLDSLGKEKTALFLILPTEGDIKSLLVPFYGFMFKRLNELAEQNHDRLPVSVRFIMDEFANIGRVPEIDKVTAVGRSKGIMVQIALQNIGQIKGLYRRGNEWETVVGNSPIKLCLSADDVNTAKFFTPLAGGAEVKHVTASKDVSMPWMKLKLSKRRESGKEVSVVKDYELLQLPEDDCVAILRGKRPIYLQKLPWTELPQYKEIKQAGTSVPADWVETRSLFVEKPPYPEETDEEPKDIERSRGGKSKVSSGDKKPLKEMSSSELDELFGSNSDTRVSSEYL
jgi:type IV secretion system protein VirD4